MLPTKIFGKENLDNKARLKELNLDFVEKTNKQTNNNVILSTLSSAFISNAQRNSPAVRFLKVSGKNGTLNKLRPMSCISCSDSLRAILNTLLHMLQPGCWAQAH